MLNVEIRPCLRVRPHGLHGLWFDVPRIINILYKFILICGFWAIFVLPIL